MNASEEKCGAKNRTKAGYCSIPVEECRYHSEDDRADGRRQRHASPKEDEALAPIEPPSAAKPMPGYGLEWRDTALEERSARRLAWWLAAEMACGSFETQRGTVLSNVLRLLHAMGPEPMDEEDALAEVELRGRLMHGQPPRDPEEWARAERTFNAEAIGEFRRWEQLILARRAGIPIQPMIEAAEDAWAEATDKWREPATPP